MTLPSSAAIGITAIEDHGFVAQAHLAARAVLPEAFRAVDLRQLQQLRGRNSGEVRPDLAHDTLIGFAVVRAQIVGQVLSRITLTRSVTDDDNWPASGQSIGNSLVEVRVLRSPLAFFP